MLFILTPAFLSPILSASEASDVFVLFDATGFQEHIDDALSGAKMFINLLDANDRVGLAALTDNFTVSSALTKPDDSILMTSLDNLTSSGSCSKNLHVAINDTVNYLNSVNLPGNEGLTLIVFSGKACKEVSDDEAIANMIETLNKKQIKVYAIGLVRYNPAQELAAETGGLFIPVAEKESYASNASILYETLRSPDVIPFQRGKFLIDESIYNVTLVSEKISKDNKLSLSTPDGKKYTDKESPKNITWHSYGKYDIVRIDNPQPGQWSLQFVAGKENRAYVNSSFKIMSYFYSPYVPVNGKIVIDAWLRMDNLYVREPGIFKSMEFTMLTARKDNEETETDLSVEKNGSFRGVFHPTEEGLYKITLNASSKTLTRGKSFVVMAEKELIKTSRLIKKKRRSEMTFTEALMVFLSVNLIFLVAAWGYMRKETIKDFMIPLLDNVKKAPVVIQGLIQTVLHRKKQVPKHG